MLATGWWPDLQPIMRMRGFLLRPSLQSCGGNFQVARCVTVNFPNRLKIGCNVYMARGCWLNAQGGVVIEDDVQIGPYAVLSSGNHTYNQGSYRHGNSDLAPIRLGRGCWIAAHVTVVKGVTVGRGSVVGANSVATTDVPDYAVAGGVPARVIKIRQSRMKISTLPVKTWN
jgi:acetyltransferase-like isoleucine patch superfamily enzyme